jgi:hypothetical protein
LRHEKLFLTSALLRGFIHRANGQLSLDFVQEYLEEARAAIKIEVKNTIPK